MQYMHFIHRKYLLKDQNFNSQIKLMPQCKKDNLFNRTDLAIRILQTKNNICRLDCIQIIITVKISLQAM